MAQILDRVLSLDSNDHETAKEVISGFLQNVVKHGEMDCVKWLDTLEIGITRFPKQFMLKRSALETYLSQFLDSEKYHCVVRAAKCCHALQQVRPPQNKAATAKSSWRQQMSTLCNAGHELIGALFAGEGDIYKNGGYFQNKSQTSSDESSTFSEILTHITQASKIINRGKSPITDPVKKYALLNTRLRNIFVFIQAMLVETYPVAKPIQPQLILDVIVRSLTASSGVIKQNIKNDRNKPYADIATIKIEALRSLDALILCLGPNLIPYSPLVFKLTTQTLRWTSEHQSAENSKIRCSAYKSLSNWLVTLHCHKLDPGQAGGKTNCMEDDITSHILTDITPERHVIQLTMSNNSMKNLSKKAKRKMASNLLNDSQIANHMPGQKNKVVSFEENRDDVSIAALNCLDVFLSVCGIFLKPATHKQIQERLVRECFILEQYSSERGLALCKALETARTCTPSTIAPPTQYCLQIYSMHTHSNDFELSNFCAKSLLSIRQSLHCAPPSLNYAIVNQQEQKKTEKNKMSEKNMAALQSLLGPERFKETTLNNEIITIPDEPNRKRRKTTESDEITVSSDDDDDNDKTQLYLSSDNEEIVETDKSVVVTATVHVNGNKKDIHNLHTQMPETIIDLHDQESNDSIEIAYDSGCKEKTIDVIEKVDDEKLPSSNETDDIQITCGQKISSSQEVDFHEEKNSPGKKMVPADQVDASIESNTVYMNNAVENTIDNKNPVILNKNTGSVKEVPKTQNDATEKSVEEMLSHFVDEVDEEKLKNYKGPENDSQVLEISSTLTIEKGPQKDGSVEQMLAEFVGDDQ